LRDDFRLGNNNRLAALGAAHALPGKFFLDLKFVIAADVLSLLRIETQDVRAAHVNRHVTSPKFSLSREGA
jgi:hypothetical protein